MTTTSKGSDQGVFDLIGQIYCSGSEASGGGWLDVYERISRMLSSGSGSLHIVHKQDGLFESIADINEPGFFDDFNSYYFPILPFRDDLLRLKGGDVFLRRRDCPDADFVPTDLYQDHFKRLGIYHVIHGCLFDDDTMTGGITFTRNEGQPDFDRSDLDILEALAPHLERGLKLHQKVRTANGRNRVVMDAWDHVSQAVVVISNAGKVVFSNKAFECFLSKGSGIEIDRYGRLVCDSSRDTTAMWDLINGAFAPKRGKAASFGGAMRVNRVSGKLPLSVLIAPFAETVNCGLDPESLALLLISDPEEISGTLERDLRQMYGFTQAEARFAALLAEGFSLIEAGEELRVTQNTVRTHLKRLFWKTDTNRQGSLIKLILSLPSVRKP